MKRFRFLVSLFLVAAALVQTGCSHQPEPTKMRSARDVISSIQMGWNLGNSLEAMVNEVDWGEAKTTPAIINYVHSQGFNAVRIPCAWDVHQKDGQIDPAWMKRVHEVVDYVINADMYCVINCHWDNGWIENQIPNGFSDSLNYKLQNYWTQIATEFRDYDDHLLFAGMNEPNIGNYYGPGLSPELQFNTATLLRYEQTFIDAVRATGGNNQYRVLIVQVPDADIDKANGYYIGLPIDPTPDAMAVEAHFYGPWQLTGLRQDEDWGRMYYYWGKENLVEGSDRNTPEQFGAEYVQTQMLKMYYQFVKRGVPMILGEYGCLLRDDDPNVEDQTAHLHSVCDWLVEVTRDAKNNGIAPFYWDCVDGHEFNIIERKTLTIRSMPMLNALMTGSREGKYPY